MKQKTNGVKIIRSIAKIAFPFLMSVCLWGGEEKEATYYDVGFNYGAGGIIPDFTKLYGVNAIGGNFNFGILSGTFEENKITFWSGWNLGFNHIAGTVDGRDNPMLKNDIPSGIEVRGKAKATSLNVGYVMSLLQSSSIKKLPFGVLMPVGVSWNWESLELSGDDYENYSNSYDNSFSSFKSNYPTWYINPKIIFKIIALSYYYSPELQMFTAEFHPIMF